MLNTIKARVNERNTYYKFNKELEEEKLKKAEKLQKQKPKKVKLIRKGNKLYRLEEPSGKETLVGIYVKTASGLEVLKDAETETPMSNADEDLNIDTDDMSVGLGNINYNSSGTTK